VLKFESELVLDGRPLPRQARSGSPWRRVIVLLRRLPSGARPRTDPPGRRTGGGAVYPDGGGTASTGRRQAVRDRQLSGRLGRHDAERGGDEHPI